MYMVYEGLEGYFRDLNKIRCGNRENDIYCNVRG